MFREVFSGVTTFGLAGYLGNGGGDDGWSLSDEPYDAPNVEFSPALAEGGFKIPDDGVTEEYIDRVRQRTLDEIETQPHRQVLFASGVENGEEFALSLTQWRSSGTVYQTIRTRTDGSVREYESYNDGTVHVRESAEEEEVYRVESPGDTEREFFRLTGLAFDAEYVLDEKVSFGGTRFYVFRREDNDTARMYVDTLGVARYLTTGTTSDDDTSVEAELLRGRVDIEEPRWLERARDTEIREGFENG